MKLSDAVKILSEAGIDSPKHEARLLFSHFEGLPSHSLILSDPETENQALISAVKRRSLREPLQYIIGEVGFYKETYKVTPDCLIPREDTEILVDYAVKNLPRGAHFLDLCTGSGCIAISVLKNTQDTSATGADISEGALAIAKENAKRNGVCDRLSLELLDVTKDTPKDGRTFDAILSNPPYVTEKAYSSLEKEIYFEPKLAFVGGEDGADLYRAITKGYKHLLSEGGFIAYEIGYDQSKIITEIAKENGMSAEIINDLSGNPRVAVLKRI
jgi:release factor glutamine methyltransferase